MTGLRCGDIVLANGGPSVVLSCWSCRHLICEYCSRRKIRGVGWPALDRVVDEPASVGCTDLEWVGAQAKEKKSPRLTPIGSALLLSKGERLCWGREVGFFF